MMDRMGRFISPKFPKKSIIRELPTSRIWSKQGSPPWPAGGAPVRCGPIMNDYRVDRSGRSDNICILSSESQGHK